MHSQRELASRGGTVRLQPCVHDLHTFTEDGKCSSISKGNREMALLMRPAHAGHAENSPIQTVDAERRAAGDSLACILDVPWLPALVPEVSKHTMVRTQEAPHAGWSYLDLALVAQFANSKCAYHKCIPIPMD